MQGLSLSQYFCSVAKVLRVVPWPTTSSRDGVDSSLPPHRPPDQRQTVNGGPGSACHRSNRKASAAGLPAGDSRCPRPPILEIKPLSGAALQYTPLLAPQSETVPTTLHQRRSNRLASFVARSMGISFSFYVCARARDGRRPPSPTTHTVWPHYLPDHNTPRHHQHAGAVFQPTLPTASPLPSHPAAIQRSRQVTKPQPLPPTKNPANRLLSLLSISCAPDQRLRSVNNPKSQ